MHRFFVFPPLPHFCCFRVTTSGTHDYGKLTQRYCSVWRLIKTDDIPTSNSDCNVYRDWNVSGINRLILSLFTSAVPTERIIQSYR
jgi:hypothetical protein